MPTLTNMLDDLRDLLDDSNDTKYSAATKTRWINHGQNAMWPYIYQVVRDDSLAMASGTMEYTIPSEVGYESVLIGVEVETTSGEFVKLDGRQYDVVPHLTDQLLIFRGSSIPGVDTGSIRITAALPLTELSIGTDVYSGPKVTSELPIMYAMHKAMARDIESRLQWYRFSTTQGLNQTSSDDFIMSSAKWMELFQAGLERLRMPAPGM